MEGLDLEQIQAALGELQATLDRVTGMINGDPAEQEAGAVDEATAEAQADNEGDEQMKNSSDDDDGMRKASATAAISKLLG